jgi:hypothetical protein
MEAYATAVTNYVSDLDAYAKNKGVPLASRDSHDYAGRKDSAGTIVDLKPLHDAARVFRENAAIFHEWDRSWAAAFNGSGEFESNVMAIKRMSHNTRMANFETHVLDLEEGGGVSNL